MGDIILTVFGAIILIFLAYCYIDELIKYIKFEIEIKKAKRLKKHFRELNKKQNNTSFKEISSNSEHDNKFNESNDDKFIDNLFENYYDNKNKRIDETEEIEQAKKIKQAMIIEETKKLKEELEEVMRIKQAEKIEELKNSHVNTDYSSKEKKKNKKENYHIQSESEKLQHKLHNYWNGRLKKDNEVIGRDYERYIGYLYEGNGFKVYYQGINKKLEDGGIDLIYKRENHIELVQCKYWEKDKTIHEKHINQLYGATIYYKMKNDKNNEMDLIEGKNKIYLHPVFITSIKLSEKAKDIAKELGVEVIEDLDIDKSYPCIKCNISSSGNKIYHLPFDSQYDKTKITKKGECYVRTIAEAEELGFRHTHNN